VNAAANAPGEDQQIMNQQLEEKRTEGRQRCAQFVERHRRGGWTIAQTGIDPLTGIGSPTLETARGQRVSPGKLYEFHGGLYIQDQRYPTGLEWQRYYPPQGDRVIWWDGARSLRMFERSGSEHETLALEWAAHRGIIVPPDTATQTAKRKPRRRRPTTDRTNPK
jgi:hypothetical protein